MVRYFETLHRTSALRCPGSALFSNNTQSITKKSCNAKGKAPLVTVGEWLSKGVYGMSPFLSKKPAYGSNCLTSLPKDSLMRLNK